MKITSANTFSAYDISNEFPLVNISSKIESPQFREAYRLDTMEDRQAHHEHITDIVHNYWDAFLQGIPETGVNLLRILSSVYLNINAQGEQQVRYYF